MNIARMAMIVAFGAAVSCLAGAGDDDSARNASTPASKSADKNKEAANKWMQVKLRSSQEIFAALTQGDSKAIEVAAGRMLLMNALEEWRNDSKFTRHADYDAQLNAFEYATKELIRTAKHKDIDGALEAYTRLARSCVKCHQVIRDAPAEGQ
jgi:hypothetical protein